MSSTCHRHKIKVGCVALFFSFAQLSFASLSEAAAKKEKSAGTVQKRAAQPRLILILTIDQMRADTLARYATAMQKSAAGRVEGMLALQRNGVVFEKATTAGAPSVTAAGHASVCSGANPAKHGIVGNEMYDASQQRRAASTEDSSASILMTPGLLPTDPLSRAPSSGVSAAKLKTPTLADVLQAASAGQTRTVALSIKDRGAVYCGGKNPAGVYWHDYKSGSWVSSTAFHKELPAWVNNFNSKNRIDVAQEWKPILSVDDMRALLPSQAARDALKIRSPLSQWFGAGFPYKLRKEGESELSARQRFQYTPAAMEKLVDFALTAVREERLGCSTRTASEPCKRNQHPDLLTLSFSTPDLVGHGFGPESPELMDVYLNLNRSVERLLKSLEKTLGRGEILTVLTSDHGVQSLPEVLQAQGVNAGRLSGKQLREVFEQAIEKEWGSGPWIAEIVTAEVHFNQKTFSSRNKKTSDAIEMLRRAAGTANGVRGLLSRAEILNAATPEADLLRRGHDPERSGEAVVLLQKGWTQENWNAANHGTAHEEDIRIPILFSGWKIPSGKVISEVARADDIAPTVLALLGVPPAPFMTGRSFADELRPARK